MIIRARVSLTLLALAATAGLATPQPLETFEAVSIKMSGPQSVRGESGGPVSSDPAQYSFNQSTLLDLIGIAYHVRPFQISSGTPLDQEHFDLLAKVPPGASVDQFRLMMRNLLVERFHLKLHIDQKEFSAYELRVARTGSKLKESGGTQEFEPAANDEFPTPPPYGGVARRFTVVDGYVITRMRGWQATMPVIARWLEIPNEPPIVDRTGLAGKYDFTLEFTHELPGAPIDSAGPPPPIPDLFGAVRLQLGLQLIRGTLPFDYLVIESVDRRPTEN